MSKGNLVQIYDRNKDHNIYFNPLKVEALVVEWTNKKDYSQSIHNIYLYMESGNIISCAVNDDGKTKILNAVGGE